MKRISPRVLAILTTLGALLSSGAATKSMW